MTFRRSSLGSVLLLALSVGALFAGCSGKGGAADDEGCRPGAERCRCDDDACDPGLVCASKLCVDMGGSGGAAGASGCGVGQSECDGACVVLASDDAHCGACNTPCLGGSSCVGGVCSCGGGLALCGAACVNLDVDSANCGACGTTCSAGEACASGACECLSGRVACGGACTDLASDPANCGDCDVACASDEVCSESACASDCASTLTQCGQSCVDVATSVDHCGDCDSPCEPGLECVDGACACAGAGTACDGICVDTDTDAGNCGACGNACATGQSCDGGECVCQNGRTLCGGSCVDTDTSPQHCGACATACPSSEACVSGECDGSSGSGGTGGGAGNGGSSGKGGNGGSSGAGATSGAGGAGNGGSSGSGGQSGKPIVMILLDGSSSMFEPRATLWDAIYSALMDTTDGAVQAYESQLRLGFSIFQGNVPGGYPENDARCATMTSVTFGLDNHDAIDTAYKSVGDAYMVGNKWETPTGHAVTRAAAALTAYMPDPPGPKYIVLITDGNPNTCRVLDPQCGQDLSIKAVQDARAQGIRTLVLGMGDILGLNSGCTATEQHCGLAHLTDLANAGLGYGVAAQPDIYQYSTCVSLEGGLKAAYGAAGNAHAYSGLTRDALRDELDTMFGLIAAGSVP